MLTVKEVADFLRAHDNYLILTHKSPDGDTLGCAAALCRMLRGIGKTAGLLPNEEVVPLYAPYVEGLWAAEDYAFDTVVSVDIAALSLFPGNAGALRERVDLAIDHHPSHEGFGALSCVMPECAACGEILYEVAVELGQLTAEVALPLYVAVSTDTGCFVYTNVTANTHRVAAALIDTGVDFRTVNKRIFRTKTKKRLALESRLIADMEFFDGGRVVVVQMPQSLQKELALTENDTDDIASLGGLVEGQDCSITMKEKESGEWKISVRTSARVNATKVCEKFGGGGHKAASGCVIRDRTQDEAKRAIVRAVEDTVAEELGDPLTNMDFWALDVLLRVGREIEFVFRGESCAITNRDGAWFFTRGTGDERLCGFDDRDALIERVASLDVAGTPLPEIFDRRLYDADSLYIM